MTMTMTPPVMSAKQHIYIVDLAAKRPNWLLQLSTEIKQTITDVLANEQIIQAALKGLPHPGVPKAITVSAASKAISALLGVKPSATLDVTPGQPQSLKQVATKWINEAAAPTEQKPAPAAAAAAPVTPPTPAQRLRQMIKVLPDGPHMKFALTNDKGVLEFFSLDEVKSKYGTGTYRSVRKLIGSPGGWQRGYLSVQQQLSIIRQLLAFGWEQACKDYAEKHGRCFRCDAHLSDERSRAAKLGKHCAEILGWPW
jgi:hypothetical protein